MNRLVRTWLSPIVRKHRQPTVALVALALLVSLAGCRGASDKMALDLGNGCKLELVRIPAGTFLMGGLWTERGYAGDEPQHAVTISKAFYMGKYEVTWKQYWHVAQTMNRFRDEGMPVDSVSWNDAQEFCRKLSERTGKRVRLPTEAEWEYACRAGTKTRFYTGDRDADVERAGWCGAKSRGGENPAQPTHIVGQKEPNRWGLYDMHGNVWEWCQDWYGPYPAGPVVDPQGPASGDSRVLRGGAWHNNWNDSLDMCRSAARSKAPPDKRGDPSHSLFHSYNGFRVVVSATP